MDQPPIDPEILIEGRDYVQPEGPRPPRYSAADRIGMRFLALVAILLFAVWFAVTAALLVICGLLHLVTLGRLESLPAILGKQWQAACFALVCLLAGVVALFSPRFGLGIALLYIVLMAEKGGAGPFADQFRSRFQSAYYRF